MSWKPPPDNTDFDNQFAFAVIGHGRPKDVATASRNGVQSLSQDESQFVVLSLAIRPL
jgi:hypothetical protein